MSHAQSEAPTLSSRMLLAYAAMGVPLAFVGLPIYVHLPHYYATTQGLDLVTISLVLLCVRFVDAFQDPLIGALSDRAKVPRKRIMQYFVIPLILGFLMLFIIPDAVQDWVIVWMVAGLLLVYTSFSVIIINFYAVGLALTDKKHLHTRISAYREGAIMIGIMIAAALPTMLTNITSDEMAYRYFSLIFVPIILIAIYLTSRALRHVKENVTEHVKERGDYRAQFALLKHKRLRRVLLLFFLNSMPSAITSTLFLFYVEDIIGAKDHGGYMLIAFFAASACSVGLWSRLSKKISKIPALMIGMFISSLSLSVAYWLGEGDVLAYYAVCVFSGMGIAADLTLLPSIYADELEKFENAGGVGFSLWHFLSKTNMSIAAGVMLPMLAWLGYDPEGTTTQAGTHALLVSYALVPVALKCLAFIVAARLLDQPDQPLSDHTSTHKEATS